MSETMKQQNIADYFGCNVFNETVMRARLPRNVFNAVMNTKI